MRKKDAKNDHRKEGPTLGKSVGKDGHIGSHLEVPSYSPENYSYQKSKK